MRQELRVDVEFPNSTRDELGELAAEVQHGHGVRLFRCLGRHAKGWRRVKCLLEVGLDFRIVRGEDAMARIGSLAMDGAAALSRDGLFGLDSRFLGLCQCRSVRR